MRKCIIFLMVLNAAVFCTVFKRPKTKKERDTYECAVVCGYPANEDGTPSEHMKTRVDKAIELWREGKVKYLILSGGAVANKFTESDIMKKYAVSKGVPEEVIIEENIAVSTYHNMMYVKELMNKENIRNCAVVTNGWHLRKANHYARKFELDYVMVKAENPDDEPLWQTLWKYISINLHMYYMMFRGYY